jgi:transposase InsO family protein
VGNVPIQTRSCAPKTHPNALSKAVVSAIIAKRLGRRRCGQIIHQELLREGVHVSLSSVQRTLSRTRLLKKRSPWKRPHNSVHRPPAAHPGALLQCDTVHIMLPDGSLLYLYTLIDLYSRWAYAEVAQKIGSAASFVFIERAAVVAPFLFEMVQTDNGPEFQKMFLFQLAKQGIALRHSRVRKSNDNAHIERFNRTIQEECLDPIAKTPEHFRQALADYLPYYNGERLHMGINYKTPLEMLQSC